MYGCFFLRCFCEYSPWLRTSLKMGGEGEVEAHLRSSPVSLLLLSASSPSGCSGTWRSNVDPVLLGVSYRLSKASRSRSARRGQANAFSALAPLLSLASAAMSRCVRVRAMRRIQGLVARLDLDHLGRDLSIIPVRRRISSPVLSRSECYSPFSNTSCRTPRPCCIRPTPTSLLSLLTSSTSEASLFCASGLSFRRAAPGPLRMLPRTRFPGPSVGFGISSTPTRSESSAAAERVGSEGGGNGGGRRGCCRGRRVGAARGLGRRRGR